MTCLIIWLPARLRVLHFAITNLKAKENKNNSWWGELYNILLNLLKVVLAFVLFSFWLKTEEIEKLQRSRIFKFDNVKLDNKNGMMDNKNGKLYQDVINCWKPVTKRKILKAGREKKTNRGAKEESRLLARKLCKPVLME